MNLTEFVSGLPADWATTPIFRYGQTYRTKKRDNTSDGKHPLPNASYVKRSPKQSLSYLEQEPERFGAVGVYTGVRSNGLVIWDADANLATLQRKYGEDLKGPHVLSTKKNAGKWLFYVPEKYWLEVSDLSHAATGAGFEVLWGRQGVLCGAYKDKGEYTTHGDFNAVPEAPEWLIEMMRESFRIKQEGKTNSKLADSRYSTRTREERVVIAQSCLSVIPNQGRGSEDMWWRIGAAIHSELPNEEGLELWSGWSKQDAEYADDWETGDPCAERWSGFEAGKGIGFGTLVRIADEFDPNRERFHRDGCFQIVQEVEAQTLQYKREYIDGKTLLDRAKELEDKIENPALLDQAKHLLALDAGRRHSGDIDRMLDQDLTFERNKGGKPVRLQDVVVQDTDYLIPGLLPKPFTLLVHGDGGTGKSAMCQTLAKHVLKGLDFNMYGANVPVQKGKVLWLNGDQSTARLKKQLNRVGITADIDLVEEWDMQWYRRFVRMQKEGQYDLVVIDSLDGCNDSNPYEENKREFALPIKKLARRNGTDFPPCTILLIHHNNKDGKFRGTSAIKAAVDETWNMRKLESKEIAALGLQPATRKVFVEKSRDGREDMEMAFSMLDDFTYRVIPFPASPEQRQILTADTYVTEVLKVIRKSDVALSAPDLQDNSRVGGQMRKRAIRHALDTLEEHKLIKRAAAPVSKPATKGRPRVYYEAVGTPIKPFGPISTPDFGVKTDFPSAGTDVNLQEPGKKSSAEIMAELDSYWDS